MIAHHFTDHSHFKLLINGEPHLVPIRNRSTRRPNGVIRRWRSVIGGCPFHGFGFRWKRRVLERFRVWGGGGEGLVKSVNGEGSGSEILYGFDDDDDDDIFDFDDDEEEEEEDDGLSSFRGLVLDFSYRPVNIVCWKRAICMEYMEKADVLEYYDRAVNSPSGSFYIPAVLRVPYILQAVKKRQVENTLSRRGVFRRDGYICQYCFSDKDLTVDHVVPASRGGRRTWENLVTACSSCNSRKGHKTLEEAKMTLIKMPKVPKEYEIIYLPIASSVLTLLKKKKIEMPEEWQQYLSES
ncbi:hypothetical protein Droror1_Dr00016351 [Drosera rotundifolia]